MSYALRLEPGVERDLAGLPHAIAQRVLAGIEGLTREPRPPNAKPLKARLRGLWSLRIGDYRVAYQVDDGTCVVTVWQVGHRGRFYDKATRRR